LHCWHARGVSVLARGSFLIFILRSPPPDSEVDQQITGSQLILGSVLQNSVLGSEGPGGLTVQTDGPYDFYQQPNMSEARACLPAMEQLRTAVHQRLDEWPEHPALLQVGPRLPLSLSLLLSLSNQIHFYFNFHC